MDRITGRFLWKLLMHKTKKVTKPIHPLLEKEKVCPPPKLFIYSTALVSSGCMHVKKHVSVFFWDIFYVGRNQKDVGLQWYFEHESTMYHCTLFCSKVFHFLSKTRPQNAVKAPDSMDVEVQIALENLLSQLSSIQEVTSLQLAHFMALHEMTWNNNTDVVNDPVNPNNGGELISVSKTSSS